MMTIKVHIYKNDMQDDDMEFDVSALSDVRMLVFYSIMRLYNEEDIQGIDYTVNNKYHFFSSSEVFGRNN